MLNLDKVKRELTTPIFEHISSLNKEQAEKQRRELIQDIKLISQPGYFAGNCHDLYRIRQIELDYLNYRLS